MSTKSQLRHRWEAEPGITIHKRITEFLRPMHAVRPESTAPLFLMLEGLPYREEVPNGRDFRGSDFMRGSELDLNDCDFSYSPQLRDFRLCDLVGSRFDASRGDSNNFHGSVLRGCSFKQVRLRSPHFIGCDARNTCFDDAWLHNARFDDANLAGASFRGADLKDVWFSGANLQGCDFRGANMQGCGLRGTKVDANTDFRGANLINAAMDKQFDKAGNLLRDAFDLKTVKVDATTLLGEDPKAMPLELLTTALEVSQERRELEALRARQAIQLVLDDLKRKDFFADWPERLRSGLQPAEIDMLDEILDDATRELS